MFEPTEREVDKDVHKSMNMFERALTSTTITITPKSPSSILVALDHSQQDEMSISLAEGLKNRFGAALSVIDAREGIDGNAHAESVASRLGGTALPQRDGDSYEQILDGLEQSNADLIVVPSPFGRELEKVGEDSTGTVIDVLLERSSVPLLVTRETYAIAERPFERVVLALATENEAAQAAANWAVGMTGAQGNLQLMLVVEEEAVENMRAIMQAMNRDSDIDAESFGEALQTCFLPLHQAMSEISREQKLNYHLDVRQEGHSPLPELTSDQRHPLLVIGFEREDHLSQGYVHDRIRRSKNAVLIVPR